MREIASRTRRWLLTAYSVISSSSDSSIAVASGRVERYSRIVRRGGVRASAVIRRTGRGSKERRSWVFVPLSVWGKHARSFGRSEYERSRLVAKRDFILHVFIPEVVTQRDHGRGDYRWEENRGNNPCRTPSEDRRAPGSWGHARPCPAPPPRHTRRCGRTSPPKRTRPWWEACRHPRTEQHCRQAPRGPACPEGEGCECHGPGLPFCNSRLADGHPECGHPRRSDWPNGVRHKGHGETGRRRDRCRHQPHPGRDKEAGLSYGWRRQVQ